MNGASLASENLGSPKEPFTRAERLGVSDALTWRGEVRYPGRFIPFRSRVQIPPPPFRTVYESRQPDTRACPFINRTHSAYT